MATDHVKMFVEEYGPIAAQVGKQIGVDPSILLAQWGLETSYGQRIVGHHNLGNMKDVSGFGTEATDNQTKTKSKYLNFESPEAFGDYYAHSMHRLYPETLNTGSDINKFSEGLRKGTKGSYAEDTNYEKKLADTYGFVTPFYKPPEDDSSKPNIYQRLSGTTEDSKPPKTESTVPEIVPEIGAGVGGYAAYKGGVGVPNMFKPGANVFSPVTQSVIPSPETGLTPGEKWSNKTGYGAGKGTVRQAVEQHNLLKSHNPVTQKTEKLYGVASQGESTNLIERALQKIKAREMADAAEAALRSNPTSSRLLDLLGKLKGVGRVGLGALGGALSAKDAYELAEKSKKEGLSLADVPKGLSALSGLAMMSPNPAAIAGGAALQGGLAAGDYLYDKFQLPIANALDYAFPNKPSEE